MEECTVCYDTLMNQAKNTEFKGTVEPPEEDAELKGKKYAEIDKYYAQADAIYDAQVGLLKAKFKAEKLKIKASKPLLKAQFAQERFNSTDTEKYGENGIKTSFQKEFNLLLK